jgi:hypothetical protein
VRNFVGLLSTSRQIPGYTPNLALTMLFYVLYDLVFADFITIRHCRVLDTDGVVIIIIIIIMCLCHEEYFTVYQSNSTTASCM